MYLDPTIVSWLLIGGASFTAFMIGRSWTRYNQDLIIENTIKYMIDNGFVKWKMVDGELEIIPLDQEE